MTDFNEKDLKQKIEDGKAGKELAEKEKRKKNAPKKEKKAVVMPSKIFGVEDCMAPSGK